MTQPTTLVTGAAGFIGFHTAQRLLELGHPVLGIDCLNDYYSTALKGMRLDILNTYPRFRFLKADLADRFAVEAIYQEVLPQIVIHLAAQPGVRYSLDHPDAYLQSNLAAFLNVLELCRSSPPKHLLYASSSSVYGNSPDAPFSVDQPTDTPISLYAATKKANELMAYSYSHLFGIPMTGLRFFTVYGPFGRPDMAVWKFTQSIIEGIPISVYNQGDMLRDFTYIDDIVDGIIALTTKSSSLLPSKAPPHTVYNIGHNHPEKLRELIRLIEVATGRSAIQQLYPMQPGDVYQTCANIDPLIRDTGLYPSVPLEEGINRFVAWYRETIHLKQGDLKYV